MASQSGSINRGKLVCMTAETANTSFDLFGFVQYVKPEEKIVGVHLIWNCQNITKSEEWPLKHTRLVRKTEYRLLYELVVQKLRVVRNVKVDRSNMPLAGNGVIAFKDVEKNATISLARFACCKYIPAPGFESHSFQLDDIRYTVFPYQATHGAYVNDGSVIFYNGRFWNIPPVARLTNAVLELTPNSHNVPRIRTTEDIPTGFEVFIEYQSRSSFSSNPLPTLWGPAPVFGNVVRHQVHRQFSKLYDYYYRDEDEEEEEEEEEELKESDAETETYSHEAKKVVEPKQPVEDKKRSACDVNDAVQELTKRLCMSHARLPSDTPKDPFTFDN